MTRAGACRYADLVAGCRFESLTPRVDRFTPDERTDRPALGAIRGSAGTLIVDAGASPAHLRSFVGELEARGRPPVVAIALTHWHWDHSFGAEALDVPVIAHAKTAAGVAVQAAYAWDEASIRARVADGRELAFSLPHLLAEYTEAERTALRIVVPQETFDDTRAIDLGDTTVELRLVGGDHADDSIVVWEPDDRVLFLGDALYPCLWAETPYLTCRGVRSLLERLRPFDPAIAVEAHHDDVLDADAYAHRLATLERACAWVEAGGGEDPAADPDLAEAIADLRAGL